MEKTSQLIPQTEHISDLEIISRVLKGEKDLYALLIRRYNTRLYRVGMAIINSDDEMEDVMQVTYINAYEHLSAFAFKSSFSTWITRIMINECLRILRKRKLYVSLKDNLMNKEFSSPYVEAVQTPVSSTLNTELKKVLENAISQLPEKYRMVFIMREIENMSIQETHACLDISEVNVKVRFNRAKAMLRTSLNKYYQNEDILQFQALRCDRIVDNVLRQLNGRDLPK